MATHILQDAALWFDKIAVYNLLNTMKISTSRETQDDTRFGHSARSMRVGLFTVGVSASGMTDMDTYDDDLFTAYNDGSTAPLSITADATDGGVAYTFRSLETSLSPLGGSVGDLSALSIEAGGRGGVRPVRGAILHPETVRTATGTGTAHQLGAVTSSQTLYAALHVVAASGTSPTLDVIIQSDDAQAMSTPTTRATFTQATDRTAEWQSAAGAIADDWFRVSYTLGGTNPSFTFVVVAGIAAT